MKFEITKPILSKDFCVYFIMLLIWIALIHIQKQQNQLIEISGRLINNQNIMTDTLLKVGTVQYKTIKK